MKSTTTYLHFNGNCREAMTFYQACFGGELGMRPYSDPSGQPNADPHARVMHSQLARDGQAFLMGSDSPSGTDQSRRDNNFSVFVDCSSKDEVERFFAR